MNQNNNAAIYVRISEWTNPQKIDEQLKCCRQIAETNRYHVIKEVSEITNERTSNRMAIQTIKGLIDRSEISYLVIEKANRLFHNQGDLIDFIKFCDRKNVLVVAEDGLLNKWIHLPSQFQRTMTGMTMI